MNMNALPPAARVAITLRQQLEILHSHEQSNRHTRHIQLIEKMERLAQLGRLIDRAWRIRYVGSARRLQTRYDRQLSELLPEIQSFLPTPGTPGNTLGYSGNTPGYRFSSPASYATLPRPQRIISELDQLADDFGHWSLEPTDCALSVITEPVELEGIDFGRFRLSLDVGQVADVTRPLPVRVEALEPNPAAGSDHVTHPHVSESRLCPGDARSPLSRALQDGRLADFFLVLRSVLRTYNPDSAYVDLDTWDHAACCHDCGIGMHPDGTCWCSLCEHDFCDECVGGCLGCHETTCFCCLINCDHCEEGYCSHCIEACVGCGASSCPDCLEDQLCPICQEAKETENESQEVCPEATASHSASNHPPHAA